MAKPIGLAGHDGLRKAVDLSGRDSFEYSTGLDQMRVAWIARRCDLPRPVAAVVAEIAMGAVHG